MLYSSVRLFLRVFFMSNLFFPVVIALEMETEARRNIVPSNANAAYSSFHEEWRTLGRVRPRLAKTRMYIRTRKHSTGAFKGVQIYIHTMLGADNKKTNKNATEFDNTNITALTYSLHPPSVNPRHRRKKHTQRPQKTNERSKQDPTVCDWPQD